MRATRVLVVVASCVICVWLTTCTAQGQECGDNPMKQVLVVAKKSGRTLTHVLSLLRDIDAPAYETLARKFRMYAACVGLVDTGYFRKRGASEPQWERSLMDDGLEGEGGSESDNSASDNSGYYAQLGDAFDQWFANKAGSKARRTWPAHGRSGSFGQRSYNKRIMVVPGEKRFYRAADDDVIGTESDLDEVDYFR